MSRLRQFCHLLAAAGFFILLQALLDVYSGWRGMDLATPIGRMRLITLVWSKAPLLFAADACLVGAMLGLGSQPGLGRLSRAHWAASLLFLLAVPLFLTAGGEVAATVAGEGLQGFRIQMVRVLAGLAAAGLATGLAGRSLRSVSVRPA